MSCEDGRVTMAKMLDEFVVPPFENNLIRLRKFWRIQTKKRCKRLSDFDD